MTTWDILESTPLHYAAEKGGARTMELMLRLMERETLIEALKLRDSRGWTPLYLACERLDLEMAEFLIPFILKMGANECFEIPNDVGQTPLDVAKHDKVKELLRDAMAPSKSAHDTGHGTLGSPATKTTVTTITTEP
ncbi:hypothetical protein V2A60_008202 [Cordyceps javanica]